MTIFSACIIFSSKKTPEEEEDSEVEDEPNKNEQNPIGKKNLKHENSTKTSNNSHDNSLEQ